MDRSPPQWSMCTRSSTELSLKRNSFKLAAYLAKFHDPVLLQKWLMLAIASMALAGSVAATAIPTENIVLARPRLNQ